MYQQANTFLTYYQTSDNFRFALYTLAIVEEMHNKAIAGKVSTKSILKLMEAGHYHHLKEKFLGLQQQDEIRLSFEDLGTFCILIDFSASCLTSSIFHTRLKRLYKDSPFDSSVNFDQFSSFYIKYAANFMDYLKKTYPANEGMASLFRILSSWDRNDSRF